MPIFQPESKGASRASFAGRLRRLRTDAGLSQKDLEKLSGIPKSRISRYENGHLLPSMGGLRQLAGSLDVPDSTLMGENDEAYAVFVRGLKQRGVTFETAVEAEQAAQRVAEIFQGLAPRAVEVRQRRA